MCGIAGYYNDNSNLDEINSVISEMNTIQIHRGPNSSDKYFNSKNSLGLIMCRLSILDLDLGKQPMSTKDGRYTIIFNGTILNSPILRTQLENKGVRFFTNNSDTEVLLQILINYGKNGLEKLNGSFAFAFYDNLKNKLLCARDRFGLAPFYFYWKNKRFLFASELKSILNTKYCSHKINKTSLENYLSLLWVPGPDTIIEEIKKLPAGNYLEIDFNSNLLKIDEWWDIKIEQENNYSENETIEKLLDVFNESVQRSTLSDVPLACGLSGGLDSQAIVSMLVKNNIKINTFTLGFQGFGDGDLNELKVAKTAANFFKTNHHEMIVETKNYFNDLDKMIYHLDEPYGGGLPLWHVLKNAGKKFGVILTGLGGDELFGNFGRWTLLEKSKFNLFQNKYHFDTLFFNRKYFFTEKLKKKILIDKTNNSTSDYMYNILNRNQHYNIRDKIMYLDLKTQLQDEYCNVVNKFSMANQIEARAPFLDNEFTNLIFKISSNIRTKKNDFKNLLRKMMKNHIANENLYNRKIGFIGLESQKLNYDFKNIRENLFSKKKIKAQEIFNYEFLNEFLKSFENNNPYTEKNFLFRKIYGYKSFWALIMFQKWYDIFISKDNNFKIEISN